MPKTHAQYDYVDTAGFLALCRNAEDNKFNRQCDTELVERDIDPDGKHVLAFSMIHNDDHLRTQWFVKSKDSDDPVSLWLDVTFDAFNTVKKEG